MRSGKSPGRFEPAARRTHNRPNAEAGCQIRPLPSPPPAAVRPPRPSSRMKRIRPRIVAVGTGRLTRRERYSTDARRPTRDRATQAPSAPGPGDRAGIRPYVDSIPLDDAILSTVLNAVESDATARIARPDHGSRPSRTRTRRRRRASPPDRAPPDPGHDPRRPNGAPRTEEAPRSSPRSGISSRLTTSPDIAASSEAEGRSRAPAGRRRQGSFVVGPRACWGHERALAPSRPDHHGGRHVRANDSRSVRPSESRQRARSRRGRLLDRQDSEHLDQRDRECREGRQGTQRRSGLSDTRNAQVRPLVWPADRR